MNIEQQPAWVSDLVEAERAAFASAAAVNRVVQASAARRAVSTVAWWMPELFGVGVLAGVAVSCAAADVAVPAWIAAVLAVVLLTTVVVRQVVLVLRNKSIRRAIERELAERELAHQDDDGEPVDELGDQDVAEDVVAADRQGVA